MPLSAALACEYTLSIIGLVMITSEELEVAFIVRELLGGKVQVS